MKPLIVANWKMNPQTLAEANRLFNSVKNGVKNIKKVEVVICPPFLYLFDFLSRWIKSQILKLGAQDCFWEEKGAFTGEVSPTMLKDLGCKYVIIGHSERRALGETNEMINKKIRAVLKANLKPILCIGETEKERKEEETKKVLKNQLEKDLTEVRILSNLIVAYEPVWAIGTGNFCPPKEAKKVFLFLRKILKNSLILYGGSVNSQNAADYVKKADFQGLLVGGASLDPKEFIRLVTNVAKT